MYVLCAGCYEEGSTGSMAEDGSVCELERLEEQFQSLASRYTSDELRADSKPFCSDFCKMVEEHASCWQVPLPQLRILETALCYFTQASTVFAPSCDHVLRTLSSLALSVFELLLFFDQGDLERQPLKSFTETFRECYSSLARHQNVHLLQVERLVRGGGPWASPALRAILSVSSLPQSEVDECISSELPVFFELRVRYLLSCERVGEALALARCCARHPTAGQHLFFLQVYLTWLLKTSQRDGLLKEVSELTGKDAVHIICSLECEETDEVLLALTRAFLSQQLCRGDMYYLCDLVFIWSKLHHRLKTLKADLLEEIHQLMLSATNVNSIFPFIRAVLQEVGEDGIQFCVELCANALRSCLPCDVVTKSLIYKTIAGLLPNDLEVCRACALLVFFLERTVEAYKTVYLLYMHPDQEYHVECSPIRNHVRFETLQVLKKDLYFDPEFWNLIALRTNCLKLMSEKAVSAALEEIMEDKWLLNYCTKETAQRSSVSACQKGSKGPLQAAARKQHQKEATDITSKRLKVGPGKTRLNHTVKRKGSQGSRPSSEPPRRSFWQLDRLQDNWGRREHRRTTRLSEKNPPKRTIRTPKWLLEDSGTLEENSVPSRLKKHRLKHQKHHQPSVERRSETGQLKNNAKHKHSVNSGLMAKDSGRNRFSLDCLQPASPPQVILELSLPDNELMGTFTEDACNRHRGFPQVLLYKPTVKLPAASQPAKTGHHREVILRARDAAMFAQQLHCYARRPKGKGSGSNAQGSVSTITRSSLQASPPKGPQRKLCETPSEVRAAAEGVRKSPPLEKVHGAQTASAKELSAVELEGAAASRSPEGATVTGLSAKLSETTARPEASAAETNVAGASHASHDDGEPSVSDKVRAAQTRGHREESAVEMKVTIASQTPAQSPGFDEDSRAQTVVDTSEKTSSAEVSPIPPGPSMPSVSDIAPADSMAPRSRDVTLSEGEQLEPTSLFSRGEAGRLEALAKVGNVLPEVDVSLKSPGGQASLKNDASARGTAPPPPDLNSMNDISALTLVTEMVTELAPETQAHKWPPAEDVVSKESRLDGRPKFLCKSQTTTSCSFPELAASAVIDARGKEADADDAALEKPENSEPVESEESKLEYCCTFCNKVFKGSRVVAHAMFHYRKDECMFCGMMFKDDLIAMMHLSDHIEKLKRSKDSAGSKVQENLPPETKDIAAPKSSAKAKTTNASSGHRGRGRPRKSAVSSKSVSLPDSNPSGSRKLRSNGRPLVGLSLQEKNQNSSKHLSSRTSGHKVNGHIGKNKEKTDTLNSVGKQPFAQLKSPQKRTRENPVLRESQDLEMISATSVQVERESSCSPDDKTSETETLHVLKAASRRDVEEKNAGPRETVCCPVDGCRWSTDLSKNRVALLYHALEDHHGEARPLELAFRVGNSKCSICMRVLWSFEHFQHHVERHRLAPRHPCLHQGCTARFKTGMEMRRHTRRHSPLQAVCCLPGCSQLFICLWALNLHEREHYASRPTKPDKHANKQTLDHKPKPENATLSVNKTVGATGTGQAAHKALTEKPVCSTAVRASVLKQKFKRRNGTKDAHVLKNLFGKDTSAQPTGPTLRLRQRLRKIQALAALKSHKVISSSSLNRRNKVRDKFKRNQVKVNAKPPKRRGRPPKSKKDVRDENGAEAVQVENDQRRLGQLSKAAATLNAIKKFIEKSKTSKQMKNHVKQKGDAHCASEPVGTDEFEQASGAASHADGAQKAPATKRPAPEEDTGPAAPADASESKKRKATSDVAEKERPEPDAVESGFVGAADDGRVDEEREGANAGPDRRPLAVPRNGLNETPAPPTTSGGETLVATTREESKKSDVAQKKGRREKNAASGVAKKDPKKKGDKKRVKDRHPCKDANRTRSKKTTKPSASAQKVETAEDSSKGETPNATTDTAATAASCPNETSLPSTSAEEQRPRGEAKKGKKEKSRKSIVTKNRDLNKARKKRKVAEEGRTKAAAATKVKDQGLPSVSEESGMSQSEGPEGNASEEPPQPSAKRRGHPQTTRGQAAADDFKSTVCVDALAEYGKKPYTRPPPTAYLDERYTTMPKRRKEVSFLQASQRAHEKERAPAASWATAAAAAAAPPQRQRCANCFATFGCAEDLRGHLQLQTCSNRFGFDSDDEGNG